MPNSYSVLVVEDEPDGAAVVQWMLKSEKLKADMVVTGEEALAMLHEHPNAYKAILIDLALPGMDGFQLLEQVKNGDGKSLPAIAMTAFHTPELRERALKAGFDAYVAKPIDKDRLTKALSQFLN